MPLNGGGTASRVPGTSAAPNQTIKSADYEASMDDIYNILNTPPSSRANLSTPGLTTDNVFSGANTFSKIVKLAKGADVASASALTLGDDGNYFDVTGTTTITSIASKGVGTVVKLHFDGVLTLTHDSTGLILPGGANITTTAGDEAEFVEYAAGDWRCVNYQNSTGLCRAWVSFNGTGTVAIRGAANVSSITDIGTGDYAVRFTNDMPDENYSASVASSLDSNNPRLTGFTTKTVSTLRVRVFNSAFAPTDETDICVTITR